MSNVGAFQFVSGLVEGKLGIRSCHTLRGKAREGGVKYRIPQEYGALCESNGKAGMRFIPVKFQVPRGFILRNSGVDD